MFIIFDLFYILVFPFFAVGMMLKGKWHGGMKFRLGQIPASFRRQLSDQPKIWIHAVSVGEVLAVAEFVKRLSREYPLHQIICSTVTKAGFELASANLKDSALVIFAPIDFSWVVRAFVDVIRPRIYISAETELWPNLYRCLAQKNIPIVLINGRISDRSFKSYRRGKMLLRPALGAVRAFAMQTEEDARRMIELGAHPSRVQVVGNLKFDTVKFSSEDDIEKVWGKNSFFLAGSTHPGEEEIVIDAFLVLKKNFPEMRLMIAPRHIERTEHIMRLLNARGLSAVRLSSKPNGWLKTDVIVVDQMGQLRDLYKNAAVVFIGKTFKVGGGQNMIEPLAFGKPTFVGPLTQNFKDVVAIFLKAGVIIRVDHPEQLAEAMIKTLKDTALVKRIQIEAPQVIRSHQGSTDKLMNIVNQL